MRKITFLLVFLFFSLLTFSQPKWNQRYQDYIDAYKNLAIEQMLKYEVPASITLAQGLLESAAGHSDLAIKGNNHFGIKCHGWGGREIYHDDDEAGECFRSYDNVKQSYEDHSKFLRNGRRYASLFTLNKNDYRGWAHGLKAAGYATNPKYAFLLIGIIEIYKLYEYDDAKTFDRFLAKHEPDTKTFAQQGNLGYHPVKMCNKNYYVVARDGDTFKSIAHEIGVSYRAIARYNERDRNDILSKGDIVYLKKKRTKADKSFKGKYHEVRLGESMYSISQLYGIRLKSLYKKNGLTPDYEIHIGDRLRVY